jgi:hypothetical protein
MRRLAHVSWIASIFGRLGFFTGQAKRKIRLRALYQKHSRRTGCNKNRLLALLDNRFKAVDFKQAARDVSPFIADKRSIELWSQRLFRETANRVQVV